MERTAQQTLENALDTSHGIEPLDFLLDQIRASQAEWEQLAALHGPFGLHDHIRKMTLEKRKMGIRFAREVAQEKVTDALIDTLGHADPEYEQFLNDQLVKRARYLALQAEREGLILRIQRGQALLRVAANEFATANGV